MLKAFRAFLPTIASKNRNGYLKPSLPASDRSLLSKIYIPRFEKPLDEKSKSTTEVVDLRKAGFVDQTSPGIFHMLPLGLRVQQKLEALIDKNMSRLGACKVELSSISSEKLWMDSGRLTSSKSELFTFSDRRGQPLLLSPTHEEEITTLLSRHTPLFNQLPLRLYQISRKYRDEKRPRQGLLRAREFLMKDLYTFDISKSLALATYAEVRKIYARIFDELKLPYLVAEADSGNIGGTLSHEYHLPAPIGEDSVITCNKCGYTANEEVASNNASSGHANVNINLPSQNAVGGAIDFWCGISKDKSTLIYAWFSSNPKKRTKVSPHAIKEVFPDVDSSIENPKDDFVEFNTANREKKSPKILNIIDGTFPPHLLQKVETKFQNYDWGNEDKKLLQPKVLATISKHPVTQNRLNILRIQDGDSCARCGDGKLTVQKAIEVGHTFHLGTRYSRPLRAFVPLKRPSEADQKDFDFVDTTRNVRALLQMGCHGIGVSRLIGAVASILGDHEGLNWPRVIAPFELVVMPTNTDMVEGAEEVYDTLTSSHISGQTPIDAVIDDRSEGLGWRTKDVAMLGIPVLVIIGKRWKEDGICEVECRRLKIREEVSVTELPGCVRSILAQL